MADEVTFLSAGWLGALVDACGDLPRTDGATIVVAHTATGSPHGEVTYWTSFEDGRLVDADLGGYPDAAVTITAPYALASDLATGQADPAAAFMQGRIKVGGDQAALLRLLALMATPEHRAATQRLADRTRA